MNEEKQEFYKLSVKETIEKLNTSENGLSEEEVKKRLEKYGKNELREKLKTPKWLLFLSQFKELLVLVLIVAGVISFLIGSYKTAIAMFVIVFINAVIGFVQKYKAENILERLKELIESPAKVNRDGELVEISQEKLVPGDIIKLEEGDKIPADIRLIESFNLRTNDFSLTGESMPKEKHTNTIKEDSALADRDNMAFVGTTVATGSATGVVVATGMDTEMGKVTDLTQETGEIKSPLQIELDNLAKKLTMVVIVISAFLLFTSLWQGFSIYTSMVLALGIAVSSVPQALPAQVTVALSTGSKRLADRNAVVKSLPSVETLGSTTVICTDKTGTLTKNEMTVRSIWFDGGKLELTGSGYEPKGEILDENEDSLSQEKIDELEILMDSATMASNAEIHDPDDEHDRWYPIGDPTEAALITASRKIGTRSPDEDGENPELEEFSFDSERKRMSSVREIHEEYALEGVANLLEDRNILAMKGGTNSILSISKHIYKDGEIVPIKEEDKERIRKANEEFSQKAMRVLAIAYRPLDEEGKDYKMEEVERDVVFLGLMAMIDPPKEGVKQAIGKAHEAHVRTYIMTGDHATTARAIGEEIGLSDSREKSQVVTGKELKEMTDEQLKDLTEKSESLIFSRVDPEDKLRIVETLEEQEEVVAVTGDGVNDAPALKKAHIGVAMGQKGTDVAKEASELVLLDDSYPTLVHAVREGRTIYNNLRKTVLASMTTNAAELVTVLFGLFAVAMWNWAMPILVIQILAIDLLAEIMPLTFLTYDPPSEFMMTSPPRSLKEHIIDRFTGTEVIFLGLLIGGLAFMNFALFTERAGVQLTVDNVSNNPMLYSMATTMSYLTIAYCQFANILSRRYDHTSIFNRNFFGNKILLGSIVASIGLVFLGVYGPGISSFLSLGSIRLVDWLYVLLAAGIFLGIFEIMKLFKRLTANEEKQTETKTSKPNNTPNRSVE